MSDISSITSLYSYHQTEGATTAENHLSVNDDTDTSFNHEEDNFIEDIKRTITHKTITTSQDRVIVVNKWLEST